MNSVTQNIRALNSGVPLSCMTWGRCEVIATETTKELVDYLLTLNTHNRNPKDLQIANLKQDQEENRWFQTAQGIGVSKEGVLLDGQNRLIANRRAGYPAIQVLIVTGLETESQAAVDQHCRRSMVDTLSLLMNIEMTSRIVATMNMIINCRGLREPGEPFSVLRDRTTPRQVAGAITEWNDYLDIAGVRMAAPINATICSYARFGDADVARLFLTDMKSMTNLPENSPVLRLTSAINQHRSRNGEGRLYLVQATASAIQAYGEGRSLSKLYAAKAWDIKAVKKPPELAVVKDF